MEPYIPLIKAIVISTMWTWGSSSEVVITDKYILRVFTDYSHDDDAVSKSYGIYELKTNMVHIISWKMDYQVVGPVHPIDHSFDGALESTGFEVRGEADTTIVKENLGEFKCKKEEIKIVSSSYHPVGTELNSYFAKIPWLDKILDTKEKREYAGFERQEYTPYHYLVNEIVHFPNMTPQNNVIRIINKSEVDTTFIHTLLSLPIRNR